MRAYVGMFMVSLFRRHIFYLLAIYYNLVAQSVGGGHLLVVVPATAARGWLHVSSGTASASPPGLRSRASALETGEEFAGSLPRPAPGRRCTRGGRRFLP